MRGQPYSATRGRLMNLWGRPIELSLIASPAPAGLFFCRAVSCGLTGVVVSSDNVEDLPVRGPGDHIRLYVLAPLLVALKGG